MTNLEGRVLRRRRAARRRPAGVRDELWIMAELARRLDAPGTYPTDPEEVFDELAPRIGRRDRGLLGHRLRAARRRSRRALAVPRRIDRHAPALRRAVLARRRPGAHRGGRARDRGRAARRAPASSTLITGRLLEHYQSGAQTRRVPELAAAQPEVRVSMHPATAQALGILDGDMLELDNVRGTMRGRAILSTDLRPGTVFVPFHFGGDGAANLLTSDRVDPVSAMPEFKTGVVRVRRAEEELTR